MVACSEAIPICSVSETTEATFSFLCPTATRPLQFEYTIYAMVYLDIEMGLRDNGMQSQVYGMTL